MFQSRIWSDGAAPVLEEGRVVAADNVLGGWQGPVELAVGDDASAWRVE